jgi:hypothetical protein
MEVEMITEQSKTKTVTNKQLPATVIELAGAYHN